MTTDDLRERLTELLTDYQRGAVPDMASRIQELLAPAPSIYARVGRLGYINPSATESASIFSEKSRTIAFIPSMYDQADRSELCEGITKAWNSALDAEQKKPEACEHKAARSTYWDGNRWCGDCGALVASGWHGWRLPASAGKGGEW